MICCDDILDYYDRRSNKMVEIICKNILDEFFKATNVSYDFFSLANDQTERFIELKDEFIYKDNYLELFFSLLDKYKYNYSCDIIDAIIDLTRLRDPNSNKEVIRRYLNARYINDISFNGKSKFTIEDELLGQITFELAKYKYIDNPHILYILHPKHYGECHDNVEEARVDFFQCPMVTSILPYLFEYYYFYHSYIHNITDNEIIDLSFGIVMNKENYNTLFKPRELSIVKPDDFEKELILTDRKTNQIAKRCSLLRIALYKQLKNIKADEKQKILEYKMTTI